MVKPKVNPNDHVGQLPLFIPMAGNADIEREFQRKTSGAFSDEARVNLALAVQAGRKTVVLDKRRYNIKYRPDLDKVFVQLQDRLVPCGWFSRNVLRLIREGAEVA